jgi:hypothetical protein
MDSHESHCTLDTILYARENGIHLITFPTHCSHQLQPLDVGVMGPFKTKLQVAQNDWMTTNPGKTILIHNLVSLNNTAYQASFTIKNIVATFWEPGIWPFSRLAFNVDNFQSSYVTDRERYSLQSSPTADRPTTTTKLNMICQESSGSSKASLTPEEFCPFPKARRRHEHRGRKKAKSHILTNAPERTKLNWKNWKEK